MSTIWWMYKQSVVYQCNRILFSNKKELTTYTCCCMDWSWKHYAKCRSRSQKTTYHMIPFIWNVQEGQIYKDRRYISGFQGLGKEWNGKWLLANMRFLLEVMKRFWNCRMVMTAQLAFTKIHKIVKHLKWVHHIGVWISFQ